MPSRHIIHRKDEIEMTKIFWPNTGSQQSLYEYVEYSKDEARKLIKRALGEKRIVVDISTNKRLLTSFLVDDDSVVRVYPLVGGG